MSAPPPGLPHAELAHHAQALAARFPGLLVAAERVATTVAQGVHGRRRVGQGETFWQFRRYQPDDAATSIDWRQSARAQPLYVRETEWEAAQTVWLWRDRSASMDYTSARNRPAKAERADLLLLALTSLLVRAGERAQLMGSGARPVRGRHGVERMATLMTDPGLDHEGLPAPEQMPRHARAVLIGDFLEPLEQVSAVVRGLAAQGVRGHLVQVLDPAEATLPFSGRLRFDGMEGDGSVLIGHVEAVRGDYRQLIENHRRGLDAIARQSGWTYSGHGTDQGPEMVLLVLHQMLAERPGG